MGIWSPTSPQIFQSLSKMSPPWLQNLQLTSQLGLTCFFVFFSPPHLQHLSQMHTKLYILNVNSAYVPGSISTCLQDYSWVLRPLTKQSWTLNQFPCVQLLLHVAEALTYEKFSAWANVMEAFQSRQSTDLLSLLYIVVIFFSRCIYYLIFTALHRHDACTLLAVSDCVKVAP